MEHIAKHIEIPNDSPSFASDFWPNVINGIREYAPNELFIYGEILNSPGDNFSISNYTQYMSVTTYVGSGSSYLATDTMIKQTWAIVASRRDATPLFLARPYYS